MNVHWPTLIFHFNVIADDSGLIGSIPAEIGCLTNLNTLDLSEWLYCLDLLVSWLKCINWMPTYQHWFCILLSLQIIIIWMELFPSFLCRFWVVVIAIYVSCFPDQDNTGFQLKNIFLTSLISFYFVEDNSFTNVDEGKAVDCVVGS